MPFPKFAEMFSGAISPLAQARIGAQTETGRQKYLADRMALQEAWKESALGRMIKSREEIAEADRRAAAMRVGASITSRENIAAGKFQSEEEEHRNRGAAYYDYANALYPGNVALAEAYRRIGESGAGLPPTYKEPPSVTSGQRTDWRTVYIRNMMRKGEIERQLSNPNILIDPLLRKQIETELAQINLRLPELEKLMMGGEVNETDIEIEGYIDKLDPEEQDLARSLLDSNPDMTLEQFMMMFGEQ